MNLLKLRAATFLLLIAAFAFAQAATAGETEMDEPMVLVASQLLDKGPWQHSVLLALPDGRGAHFGFLLNKLTNVSLAQLLPDQKALPRMNERVYLGGPLLGDRLFVLARGQSTSDPALLEISTGLFLAADGTAVDRLLADGNRDARFFVGMVVWRPGELQAELDAGSWQTLEAAADIVLSADPDQQWRQLAALAHATRVSESYPRLAGPSRIRASAADMFE